MERAHCSCLCWDFSSASDTSPPPPLQRSLLWMLPLEMWQEALDFCSFPDYTRMICFSWGFYYLFKQSLLELRIDTLFPSPALGGLWMASRDMQATFTRVLHLGLSVFGYLRAFGELHFSSFLLAGNLSMASPVAVEQLLEIVPLPFLQRLVCFLIFSGSPWRR